jgi:peptide chain release factor subunit 1
MITLDDALLRTLAAWDPAGVPITSLYLSVDGRRYPRKRDYELRLDDLLRRLRRHADGLGEEPSARSVLADAHAIEAYVRDGFDRGDTRGLAVFSAHAAGLWQEVRVPRPVRDRVVVAPDADLLPLEALLTTYGSMCVALVDYAKARLFVVRLGRIEEVSDVWDDVPGRHEQGGRSQMRMQRHVDDHRRRHLKRVAETLFRLYKRRPFRHLVTAGPAEAHVELERDLHAYLRERVRARVAMPVASSTDEVLARALQIEEALERAEAEAKVERVAQAAAAGAGGVVGLRGTLAALAEDRVAELVVSVDLASPGAACPSCGRLCDDGTSCPACGASVQPVPDVVEAAVAQAFRRGCRVETVNGAGLAPLGGIGALLRF